MSNKLGTGLGKLIQKQISKISKLISYLQNLFASGSIRYRITEKFLLILSAALAISIIVAIHFDGKFTPAASSTRYITSWIGNSFSGGDNSKTLNFSTRYCHYKQGV